MGFYDFIVLNLYLDIVFGPTCQGKLENAVEEGVEVVPEVEEEEEDVVVVEDLLADLPRTVENPGGRLMKAMVMVSEEKLLSVVGEEHGSLGMN